MHAARSMAEGAISQARKRSSEGSLDGIAARVRGIKSRFLGV
tara:strand:- start:1865 stop:1990 length:126 start_codon:yes stop_codon:yes gene_type:complete